MELSPLAPLLETAETAESAETAILMHYYERIRATYDYSVYFSKLVVNGRTD